MHKWQNIALILSAAGGTASIIGVPQRVLQWWEQRKVRKLHEEERND